MERIETSPTRALSNLISEYVCLEAHCFPSISKNICMIVHEGS